VKWHITVDGVTHILGPDEADAFMKELCERPCPECGLPVEQVESKKVAQNMDRMEIEPVPACVHCHGELA
jgi:hypothetical protein